MNRELYGLGNNHLVHFEKNILIHAGIKSALKNMIRSARKDGINISIASAYRSFERQKIIWNQKATGMRDVFDDDGIKIDIQNLSPTEQLQAILRFSAIPGFSRHHFGTDLDIYDCTAIENGHKLELQKWEYLDGGPMGHLSMWLDQNMNNFGFTKPFLDKSFGVAFEPWHISFSAISNTYLRKFTLHNFKIMIQSSPILLKDEILTNADEIFETFVLNRVLER